MQGPVVDILLLLLLIVFFGAQQRSRPQLYFRFWFAGWLLVLGSYIVWEFSPAAGVSVPMENSIRYDLLVLAGIAFTMSFLAAAGRMKEVFLRAALVGVPACVAIDLQMLQVLPAWAMRPVVFLMVVAGHGFALGTMLRYLPRALSRQRTLILVIFVGVGLAMAVRALVQPDGEVMTWVMTEIMLFAALLYAYSQERVTLAGVVGAAGFTAWALFYHMAEILDAHPAALANFYLFWNLPKYCVGFSMILRIFEEVAAENFRLAEQYQALYEDFRVVYHNHPHPMWVFSPTAGHLMAANDIAIRTYGYQENAERKLRLEDLEVPLDDDAAALANLVPLPPGARRCRLRCLDGQVLWVNVYEREITFQGSAARLIMARDVSDFMDFNSVMAHRMFHDELTGLPNRALLTDRLQQSIAASLRSGGHMALLVIDIDHFKRVNDTYGHAMGDACLKEAAARLQSRIRKVDTVARMGGEEFMAVVGSVRSAADALKVAEELLRAFDRAMLLGGVEIALTVSIGMALYPQDGVDAETLQRVADAALYRAKHEGRNCIRVTPGLAQMVATP